MGCNRGFLEVVVSSCFIMAETIVSNTIRLEQLPLQDEERDEQEDLASSVS